MAVNELLLMALLLPGPLPAPPAHIFGEHALDQTLDVRVDADAIELSITTDRAEFPGAFARQAADADGDGRIDAIELTHWQRAALAFASAQTQLELDGGTVALRPAGPVVIDGYGSLLVGPKPAKETVRLRASLPATWHGEVTVRTRFRPEVASGARQGGLTRIYLHTDAWTISARDDARFSAENRAELLNAAASKSAPPWLVDAQQYELNAHCTPRAAAAAADSLTTSPTPAAPITSNAAPYATPANRLGERLLDPHGAVALWLGLLLAFGYGCGHALTPGHGKALVAAYLLGRRSTWRDAVRAGVVATIAHTTVVFALGLLAALVISSTGSLARLTNAFETTAAIGVFVTGLWLLHRALLAWRFPHLTAHDHHHGPGGHHHHGHVHLFEHAHEHAAAPVPFVTPMRALPTLTLSGTITPHASASKPTAAAGPTVIGLLAGLAPCPTGLVIIMFAVHQGRPWLGLLYATVFSAGMGLVLVAIALAVSFGMQLLRVEQPWFARAQRLTAVLSAVVLSVLGFVLVLQASRSW